MQPKIKNATLQPNATRIKNCVCSQNKNPSDECRWDFLFCLKGGLEPYEGLKHKKQSCGLFLDDRNHSFLICTSNSV